MKKTGKIILIVVIVLVAIRLVLPFFITKYVNKVLADIDGYEGSISGVGLSLYRGAYQIADLELFSVEEDVKTPFVAIKEIDISIEWEALFDGAIVGEIVLNQASLNFAVSDDGDVQTGKENDWTKTITDLLPLQINRFEIKNSEIKYIDDTSDPKVDVFFNNLNLVASNLNNSKKNKELLPSNIHGTSTTIGNGKFQIDVDINILKEIPDFDLDLKIENVDLVALNNFFQAYANVDAESGKFDFYTELTLVDKQLDGYFKPLTQNLKLLDWKKEKKSFAGKLREAMIGLGLTIFENHREKQVGSKVPISGKIDDTSIGVWKSIITLLKNAFIKPLSKNIDETIKVKQE